MATGSAEGCERQRDLVDLVGRHASATHRVVPSSLMTAYCVPGSRARVVVSAHVDDLPPNQRAAVLAHEEAHLRARHDLILEFFAVMHSTAPPPVRARRGMHEVALLIEVLADGAAALRTDDLSVARALVSVAQAGAPAADDGARLPALGGGPDLPVRLRLLATDPLPWPVAATLLLAAAVAVLAPVAMLLAPLL